MYPFTHPPSSVYASIVLQGSIGDNRETKTLQKKISLKKLKNKGDNRAKNRVEGKFHPLLKVSLSAQSSPF